MNGEETEKGGGEGRNGNRVGGRKVEGSWKEWKTEEWIGEVEMRVERELRW
jgi:hypothetical protein